MWLTANATLAPSSSFNKTSGMPVANRQGRPINIFGSLIRVSNVERTAGRIKSLMEDDGVKQFNGRILLADPRQINWRG